MEARWVRLLPCPRGFLALAFALLLVASCGDDSPAAGTQSPDTTPTVSFDGSTCTYSGPGQVLGGGLISVVLENSSDIDIDAGVFRVWSENALAAALERVPPGTGSDIVLGVPPGSVQEAWLQATANGRNEELLLLPNGLYLIDCARIPPGASSPDYVWRGGSFEVVAED